MDMDESDSEPTITFLPQEQRLMESRIDAFRSPTSNKDDRQLMLRELMSAIKPLYEDPAYDDNPTKAWTMTISKEAWELRKRVSWNDVRHSLWTK